MPAADKGGKFSPAIPMILYFSIPEGRLAFR
jgi:hypothetical protein